ncbi:uncharacterized protein LOC111593517 [Drosophila hydei]|uniref:Uncharacterized protein LOC111593517 n=1 Tax=Drosophila hydei TaxID=7224 RepID=A0A6J1L881_DROHY|nr:uncharacterized protein LOC111593517 [Drosophila hydei]
MNSKTDNDAETDAIAADDIQKDSNYEVKQKKLKTVLTNEVSKMDACDIVIPDHQLISAAALARQLKFSRKSFIKKSQDMDMSTNSEEDIDSKLLDSSQTTSTDSSDEEEESRHIELLPLTTTNTYNHLETWLSTIESHTLIPIMMDVGERRPELEQDDSDVEEEPEPVVDSANPFRIDKTNKEQKGQQPDTKNYEDRSAERQMNNFTQLIEARAAVPEFALSDEVHRVDRPDEAMALGSKLPHIQISNSFKVGDTLKVFVTEIYSPFQFWFHVVDGDYDTNLLDALGAQLTKFYDSNRCTKWQLSNYFMKAGYICAVLYKLNWRRARIVSEPQSQDQRVEIYLLDYGKSVEVQAKDLYFLHSRFAEQPALLMRGTLTDVYPLDLHWPANATWKFRQLVQGQKLHAAIKDIDQDERILFINIFSCDTTTISDLLIEAKLAGRSQNYSSEQRAANCGRRLRYLRERLPTFDMLETQVFQATDEFEKLFDNIIYMPTFFQQFKLPQMANPLRHDLQQALADWLLKFQPEELAWQKVTQEANAKIKQEQPKPKPLQQQQRAA